VADRRWLRAGALNIAAFLALLLAVAAPVAFGGRPSGSGKLPPEALRGNENRLHQYPTVSLASNAQRAAARRLLAEIRATVRGFQDPRRAAAAGFDTRTARRRIGDFAVHYLHAEHHRYSHDGRYLDPRRPEALIYANVPGLPLRLVGAMFAMPRGKRGPTPGGPLTRWHTHTVCAHGGRRGVAPRADGSCPAGTTAREGSEMLHVWFTADLRSSFAIHAPAPELGLGHIPRLLYCKH
jgi:hypothetical protein